MQQLRVEKEAIAHKVESDQSHLVSDIVIISIEWLCAADMRKAINESADCLLKYCQMQYQRIAYLLQPRG
jgi:hypothetical protein